MMFLFTISDVQGKLYYIEAQHIQRARKDEEKVGHFAHLAVEEGQKALIQGQNAFVARNVYKGVDCPFVCLDVRVSERAVWKEE